MKKNLSLLFFLMLCVTATAQTIRGEVVDAVTGEPLIGAAVKISAAEAKGVATDIDGRFAFENLPIARYTVEASYVGYNAVSVTDLMVSSAKETVVRIELYEDQRELKEVVVKPKPKKEMSLNTMMLAGGKQLSVEEASRYAGGFDDPARLVNCFAGVSSTGAENAISVHGNPPHTVQWHVEGVEIPAPNHMSDAYSLGGGLISALSAQVMANSDFAYTAFPAEYGNALGGLMDMQLRSGSNTKYEHSVGAGLLGVEAQSEGPMGKSGASYLFNYRYSLLGLVSDLGISTGGNILDYQDLNFVVNVPTKSAGTFKLFGTAWQDHAYVELLDADEWENIWDQNNVDVKQLTGIVGLSHRYQFKGRGFLKTTLATSLQQTEILDEFALLDSPTSQTYKMSPYGKTKKDLFDLTFSSVYQRRFSKRVLLKTGVNLIRHDYSINVRLADSILPTNKIETLPTTNKGDFNMLLAEAFASTNVSLSERLMMNAGVFALWNTDNDKTAIDPRLSFRYDMGSAGQLSFGYGLHSMLERMEVLAVVIDGKNVNRNLDFTRSHQFMLSWGKKLGENHNIKLDAYLQQHFDVAVGTGDDAGFSMLNVFDIYFDKQLVNKGKGRNYGVDLTLERYLTGGFYWMLNGSLFRSEYAGIDGRWHHTRFDRGWMAKALVGKEWILGSKQNKVLNVSGKLGFMGGLRHSPIDEAASLADYPNRDVIYDDTRAFECQNDTDISLDFTISYKVNRKKTANEFGLKWLNVLSEGNYLGHVYNYKKDCFEPYSVEYTMPNLYYKIYF